MDQVTERATGKFTVLIKKKVIVLHKVSNLPEAQIKIQSIIGEDTPFLSSFTFGELGVFPNGENCHGNLMISVLIFTNRKDQGL